MSAAQQPLPLDSDHDGEICIANIGTAERRRRLWFGVISLVLALILLTVLIMTGTDRLWRLPLMVLFWGATTGYFQWHDQTCVGLASVNSRKIGDTTEKIEDAGELAQVKRQARRVQLKSFVAAVPLTLIALLLPVLG